MTAVPVREVSDLAPIHRDTDARATALAAYDELLEQLARLRAQDWAAPTDCDAWDVQAMVGHMIGAAKSNASMLELGRQLVHGKRHAKQYDGNSLDATNALQVTDHADLSPEQRIETLAELYEAAVDGRMRTPGLVRRIRLPMDQTGDTPAGTPDRLAMDRLQDVVYTRDVWLHTVDIERATGVTVDRSTGPTRRVVEDVVDEWAKQHGQPFTLTLTGDGGGRFRQGDGGPSLEVETVEFCRALSGRVPAQGLFANRLIF